MGQVQTLEGTPSKEKKGYIDPQEDIKSVHNTLPTDDPRSPGFRRTPLKLGYLHPKYGSTHQTVGVVSENTDPRSPMKERTPVRLGKGKVGLKEKKIMSQKLFVVDETDVLPLTDKSNECA